MLDRLIRWMAGRAAAGEAELDINHLMAGVTWLNILLLAPVALGGLIWLVIVTNLNILREHALLFLILVFLTALFRLAQFYVTLELRTGIYASSETNVAQMVTWSGVLIFGPSALWIDLASLVLEVPDLFRRYAAHELKISALRGGLQLLVTNVSFRLIALQVYVLLGGTIPLGGLKVNALLPAIAAVGVSTILGVFIILPMVTLTNRAGKMVFAESILAGLVQTFALGFVAFYGAELIGVPLAGLYTTMGSMIYLVFLVLMLVGSFISNRLSIALERNRERSRALEQIETLSRGLIKGAPDASDLGHILNQHVPGMFSRTGVEIRLFSPHRRLFLSEYFPGLPDAAWTWFTTHQDNHIFKAGTPLPWNNTGSQSGLVFVPVVRASGEVAGGIILSRQQGQGKMEELIPATQYLAAQIAAVLDKAAGYAQMIDHQKTVQELEIAGQIQESFLSVVQDVPRVEGWQVGIFFNPARETSGDFFDVVPLGKGKWAFVVADVADKGMGAALYMALSRTLIRTYAIEYAERFKNGAEQPADVLRQANQRILSDTRSDLFVTVFFGLLDEHNGQFLYANAGHNPAFLIKEGAEVERMTRTGIPLGLFPDLEIHCAETHIKPGDTLILYTDGMTEAENDNGDFFGEQRFLQSIQRAVHLPVSDMMSAVLDEITTFVGEASQSDDLTMMVIRREK